MALGAPFDAEGVDISKRYSSLHVLIEAANYCVFNDVAGYAASKTRALHLGPCATE